MGCIETARIIAEDARDESDIHGALGVASTV